MAPTSVTTEKGGPCPYCTGALPVGRGVTFCPHCGMNVTVAQCPACSSEVEPGWRFCVTCGRDVRPTSGGVAGTAPRGTSG